MSGIVPVAHTFHDNSSIITQELEQECLPCEYGNKYRRLLELDALCKATKLDGVIVPLPFGFSKAFLYKILKNQAPDVFSLWNDLANLYNTRNQQEEAKAFLERSDAQLLIKTIQDKIVTTFTHLKDSQTLLKELGLTDEFDTWLASINGYLMVRSSGDEDASYANAGGNISIAYVSPVYNDVIVAAGKVVASCFSTESLLNRLNAKTNPFSSEPHIAVCLQELIGEDNGIIPTSLVLFTHEPNYSTTNHFRIMSISATLGHGEAVVGNRGIQTDSYYLLQSRVEPNEISILSNIKEKKVRLAPVFTPSGPVLEKKPNPEELKAVSSLSETMLKKLFILGTAVEAHYEGKACDMELVIKNGIIYPVQVRPINRPKPTPTYVDPVKRATLLQNPVLQSFYGNSQVVGSACVQQLVTAEELVIATTLEEAQKSFYIGREKIVVFQQPEPQESHFVVNFSEMGIPCIQMQNIDALKTALQEEEKDFTIVVDIQEGSVTLWDNVVDVSLCISEGYFSHPAPLSVTVLETKLPPLPKTDPKLVQELKALITTVKASNITTKAVELLKNHPEVMGFRKRRKDFKKALASVMTPRCIQALQATKALDKALQKAFQEAVCEVPDRLESLFRVKVVEQLLLQPQQPDGSLGKLSLTTAESLFLDMKAISSQVKMPHQSLEQLDLILDANEIPFEETKKRWIDFVLQLDESKLALKPFFELLGHLRAARSIATWITLTFDEEAATFQPQELLEKALNGIDDETVALMHTLQRDAEMAQQMKASLTPFSDTESCLQSLEQLEKVLEPYTTEEFLAQLQSLFAKGNLALILIAQRALNELIDLHDKAIKTVKITSSFPEKTKIILFTAGVGMFFEFFDRWMSAFVTAKELAMDEWDISTYMQKLRNASESLPKTAQTLQPSEDFEVAPALLLAKTDLGRHMPATFEDLFTLVHQNLLDVVAALAAKSISSASLKKLPLPQVYKEALELVPTLGSAQLLGVEITADSVVASFNLPIRNHSSTFELVFDAVANKSYLKFRFLGQARGRWDAIRARFAALHMAKLIDLVEPPKRTYSGLYCSLELHENTVKNSFAIIKTGVEISLETARVTDNLLSSKECLEPLIENAKDIPALLVLCRQGVAIQDMTKAGLDDQSALELLRYISQNTESVIVKQNALTYFDDATRVQDIPDAVDIVLRFVKERDLSLCNGALDCLCYLLLEKNLPEPTLQAIQKAIVSCSVSRSQYDRQLLFMVYDALIDRGLPCYRDAFLATEGFVLPSHFQALTELYSTLIAKKQYKKEIFINACTMRQSWIGNGITHAESLLRALMKDTDKEFTQSLVLYMQEQPNQSIKFEILRLIDNRASVNLSLSLLELLVVDTNASVRRQAIECLNTICQSLAAFTFEERTTFLQPLAEIYEDASGQKAKTLITQLQALRA